MPRLIDADRLKQVIADNVYLVQDAFNSRDYGMFWTGGIEKAIDDAPTVDAVVVVRCKDCKFWHTEGQYCDKFGSVWKEFYTEPYDYCSRGERREDAEH